MWNTILYYLIYIDFFLYSPITLRGCWGTIMVCLWAIISLVVPISSPGRGRHGVHILPKDVT